MSIIQILILIFALFALSRAFLRFREKSLTVSEFIFWTFIWVAVIVVSIYPDLISEISSIVGIGRGVDFAVYISVIILFYLVYRIYVKLDEHDQKMNRLMRELIIKTHKKK
jgi:small membrane protein